jgi:hypothetical protein
MRSRISTAKLPKALLTVATIVVAIGDAVDAPEAEEDGTVAGVTAEVADITVDMAVTAAMAGIKIFTAIAQHGINR